MTSVKNAAARVYRLLITLYTAAVIAEIFLAGLGVFRAMPGDSTSISHETFDGKFDTHAALGVVLFGGSLLLLIVTLAARLGVRWIGATTGLAVLTLAQGALAGAGEDAPVAGAFHVINAVLILGLSLFLTVSAWRGRMLSQPAHHQHTGLSASSVSSDPSTERIIDLTERSESWTRPRS